MEYKEYASKGVAVEIYPREGTETSNSLILFHKSNPVEIYPREGTETCCC